MACCSTGDDGLDEVFTDRTARRELWLHRLRGPARHERALVDLVRRRADLAGTSVLEVGGGLGAVQVELLRAGATDTTNVDAVAGWEQAADELLAREGLTARVRRIVVPAGSATTIPADLAIAHRVVCCTTDWRGVVDLLVASDARVVALTLPVDAALVRLWARGMNRLMGVLGRSFRFHVHRHEAVVGRVRDAGYALVDEDRRGVWRTVVLAA